jgi:hypothetical protein
MHYSSGDEDGWFDLEGIADDGLGYRVNIIRKRDNQQSVAEKASNGHLSSETGTSTLLNSGLIDLALAPSQEKIANQKRQVEDAVEPKFTDGMRIWKIDQPIFESVSTDSWRATPTSVQALATEIHPTRQSPELSRQRGPINPLNSSQQWAGPNARISRSRRTLDNPTLPIIQPKT